MVDFVASETFGAGDSVLLLGGSKFCKSLPHNINIRIGNQKEKSLQYNDSNNFISMPLVMSKKENLITKNEKTTQNSTVYLSDKNIYPQVKRNKETVISNSNVALNKRGKEELMKLFTKNQKFEANSEASKNLKRQLLSSRETSPKSLYGGDENEDESKIKNDMKEKEGMFETETKSDSPAVPYVIMKEYSARGITPGTENQPMKNSYSAALYQKLEKIIQDQLFSAFPSELHVFIADPVIVKNVLNNVWFSPKKNKADFEPLTNEKTDVVMNMIPQPIKDNLTKPAPCAEPMKQMDLDAHVAENKMMSELQTEEGKVVQELEKELQMEEGKVVQELDQELQMEEGKVVKELDQELQTEEGKVVQELDQKLQTEEGKVVQELHQDMSYQKVCQMKSELDLDNGPQNQTLHSQMPSKHKVLLPEEEVHKTGETRAGKTDRHTYIKPNRTKSLRISGTSSKYPKTKLQRKKSLKNVNNKRELGTWIKRNKATLTVFEKPKPLDMKKGGNFRCCSQGGATGSGNGFHSNSAGGNNNFTNNPNNNHSNQQGSEHGKGNRDKPNDRGNNAPNLPKTPLFGGAQEMIPGDSKPAQNYKSFRKKVEVRNGLCSPDKLQGHGCDSDRSSLMIAIGMLAVDTPITSDPDLRDTFHQIEQCLVRYLISLSTGRSQDEGTNCYICIIVISLLRHFGRHTNAVIFDCTICMQLYRLFKFHLTECCITSKPFKDCIHSLSICQQIHCQAISYAENSQAFEKFLWQKLKETFYLHFGNVNLPPAVQLPKKTIHSKRQSLKRKVSSKAKLRKIIEADDNEESIQQQSVGSSESQSQPSSDASQGLAEAQFSINENASHSSILLRNMSEKPQAFPPRYGRVETPFSNIHFYGEQGCQSVPTGYLQRHPAMLSSLEDRVTGFAGIGEVVYGDHSNLRIIAEHWTSLKENHASGQPSQRQKREEGVILKQHMDKLNIGKTRFQEGVQWEKLSPLGQGVSGRCYLARDYNSEFQFCVKQIHIIKYFEEELTIWSKLNHPNIVQLYGAIRCGNTIFIMAEFVDGGCLTEHINNHRELKRRLSKAVALRYFQQLLQVLVYLQEQNVIHEDLKADNILLRATSSKAEIVVADFGLARQVQPGERVRPTDALGTPTQWSPEKAASQPYDFRSDVWAATCVLAHIFNGDPPWVRHYDGLLQYIIKENAPPLDDMPQGVTEDIEELFRQGWTKDMEHRPFASSLLKQIDLDRHMTGDTCRLYSNLAGYLLRQNSLEHNSSESSKVDLSDSNKTETVSTTQVPGTSTVTKKIPTMPRNQGGGNNQMNTRSAQEHGSEVREGEVDVPIFIVDNPSESLNDGRIDSNSSSDPQHHIEQFMSDNRWQIPQTQLPNLPIFEEPVPENSVKEGALKGGEQQQQQQRRVSIEIGNNRPRSPSAPNIRYYPSSSEADMEKINSFDLFGFGPNLEVETGAAIKPQQASLQNIVPNPRSNDEHEGNPKNNAAPKHKRLTLKVPRPGATSTSNWKFNTMQTSLNINVGAYGNAIPKTTPHTASPSLPTVVEKKPVSPSSFSSSSTSSVRSRSDSKLSSVDEGSTPKSSQSARDHQERELHSLTQSQFQEQIRHAGSPLDFLPLLGETNYQEDDDDDSNDIDDHHIMLQSLGVLNIQSHDNIWRHPEPAVSPGCVISFVTECGHFLTRVRIKDPSKNWLEVIVDIAAPVIHSKSGYQAFCVLLLDGSVVDMGAAVGTSDLQVTVVPIIQNNDDVHTWFVEDQKFHWN